MSLSAKNKYYLKRILPFGIIWLFISWAFLWTEYAVLGDGSNTPESAIRITPIILLFASTSVFFIGCFVGVIEVFYINNLFTKKSFPEKFFGKFFLYGILMFILIFVFYMLAASIEMKASVFSKAVWNQYLIFFYSITHISTGIQLLFSLIASLLYAEISENIGQNILYNFFTGRYHKPVDENRIFMFVDMKDSTTIAEKIGHKMYFKLLRDYYQSFSDAILKNYGVVYQYVGDEIVITWKLNTGLKDNHCIQCFFDMKIALQKQKNYFEKKYNFTPDFKAALHFGQVTAGEIGALKKDIFFTGDVLNTTARIFSYTNTYNADLLISENSIKKLSLGELYKVINKGQHQLKGKEQAITIYEIKKV